MLSFIVGTNKRPEELKRFIEHLSNQTSSDFEIVVADEGDNEWVKEYDVTYFKHPFKGDWHYTAKNEAVKLARGDYVCFPQDDAIYHESFVESMQKGDMAICGWDWNGRRMEPCDIVCRVDIGGFTVKRDLFTGFDGSGMADGNFVQHFKGKKVLVPDILYIKR